MLYRVYVDEAGGRGTSKRSDRHFAVAAVIVADANVGRTRGELAMLRTAVGRHPGHILHFRKLSHSQKLKSTQDVAASSIAAISTVTIHKNLLGQPLPAGNLAYIAQPDPMYLWALRLLLERVSWYVDEHGGTTAIVTFAHVQHFKTQKLHNYRRALEQTPGTEIRWGVFSGHPFRIDAPQKVELLQMADIGASALYKAVEPDAYGNVEPRYLRQLRPALYRRPPGSITSYGLKVFPDRVAAPGGPLDWLRAL